MKVAIYHRIANKNETSQYEMQKQIEVLNNMGYKNNFEIIMTEYDYGSGLNCKHEGLIKIKNAIKNKEIDALIIEDISRIGRDIRGNLEFINFAREHNVDIYVMNTYK